MKTFFAIKIMAISITSISISVALFYAMLIVFSGDGHNEKNTTSSFCDGSIIAKIEDEFCIKNPSLAIKGRPPYEEEYQTISIDKLSKVNQDTCSCYSTKATKMESPNKPYTETINVNNMKSTITKWFCIKEDTCHATGV